MVVVLGPLRAALGEAMDGEVRRVMRVRVPGQQMRDSGAHGGDGRVNGDADAGAVWSKWRRDLGLLD